MTLGVVMRSVDPALPRIGTDFMTLRVVMRIDRVSYCPLTNQYNLAPLNTRSPRFSSRLSPVVPLLLRG